MAIKSYYAEATGITISNGSVFVKEHLIAIRLNDFEGMSSACHQIFVWNYF